MNEPGTSEERVKPSASAPDLHWLAQNPLRPSTLLVAEFHYIAQTAFQSHEDRARATSYYLAAVGTLVTGFVSSQFEGLRLPAICWGFAILFIVLSVVGLLTLLQLARLRAFWFDCIGAMNRIKAFYMETFSGIIDLHRAFEFTKDTEPARFKPWSLSFLLAVQVALLSGMTLGAAVIFAGLGYGHWWWGHASALAVAYVAAQLLLYRSRVRHRDLPS